jgi:hypothetical protein
MITVILVIAILLGLGGWSGGVQAVGARQPRQAH